MNECKFGRNVWNEKTLYGEFFGVVGYKDRHDYWECQEESDQYAPLRSKDLASILETIEL